MRKTLKYLTFLFALLTGIFLALLVAGGILIQYSSFQTSLTQKVAEYLSAKTGFTVRVGRVNIHWFDRLALEEVLVVDKKNDTLISGKKTVANFNFFSFFGQTPVVEEIDLETLQVFAKIHNGDTTLNLSVFINAIKNLSLSTASGKESIRYNLKKITLKDGGFTYDDENLPLRSDTLDFSHLKLRGINSILQNFNTRHDTLRASLTTFTCQEKNSFIHLQSFSTNLIFTPKHLRLKDFIFKWEESVLNGDLAFDYDSLSDFRHFNTQVTMNAKIKESGIRLKDLNKLIPSVKFPDEFVSFQGQYTGKTGNFLIKKLKILFPFGSVIEGETGFDGLPYIHETFFDFKLNKMIMTPQDIASFGITGLPPEIKEAGAISFSGRLSGFLLDFVSSGVFKTKLGNIITDVNFKLGKSLADIYYKGTISGEKLKIEKIDGKRFGISEISFVNKMEGTGFNPDSFRVSLAMNVSELIFRGAPCKNISITGTLDPQILTGKISISDTNLHVNMSGSLTRSKGVHSLAVSGDIHRAKPGTWWKWNESLLSTKFSCRFPVLSAEKPEGFLFIQDLHVNNKKRIFNMDSLLINFHNENDFKNITLTSSLIDFSARGNFSFSEIKKDAEEFLNEIQLYLENKPDSLEKYYYDKARIKNLKTSYKANYQVKIKKTGSLFKLLDAPFYISDHSILEGYFRQGITTILNFQIFADTLMYKHYLITKGNADITLSKLYSGKELVAVGVVKSGNVYHDKTLLAENFFTDGNWHDHRMEFESRIKLSGHDNEAFLSGNASLGDEGFSGTFLPSYINYRREKWNLSGENSFRINGKKIEISNLNLTNRDQVIRITGIISENKEDKLSVFAEGLRLGMINEIFPAQEQSYSGKCKADLIFSQLFDAPVVYGDIGIQNFMINNFLVGEVHGKSKWDATGKKINIDFFVDKGNENTLHLQGVVAPYKEFPLNLTVNLKNFNLNLLEPYSSGIVSDIHGNISADLTLKGTFEKPEINGIGYLKNASARVNYLNVVYYVNTTLRVLENNILFENSVITDPLGNNGYVNGIIRNKSVRNVSLDFGVRLENLMTLKTTSKNNDLYYGTVFTTGDLNIKGDMDNLIMDARVRTEKGTDISIPVNAYHGNEKRSYIRYITQEDLQFQREAPVDLSGLLMNFDVEVTPDAVYRIIFDEKTGDILRGNGRGELKMEIDTKGDFNIFGNLEIVKGVYNFTFQQFVNKEFLLLPGPERKISWSGNPNDAEINLRAEYVVNATITGILEDTLVSKKLTSKRQDVHILMDLTGKLNRPDITYTLDIPTMAQGETGTNQFTTGYLNELKTNEYEMNKQIFSLLVLRRFAPPREDNLFAGEGGKAALVGSSVQEFLSNQVSSWLSQSNPYVSVDLNLGQTFDEQALKELEVKLTASLFGGRMRLIREGDFVQATPDESKARSIAGDWSIEYDITKDGKLKFMMYNKLNPFSVALENNYTTGFGLVHSASFNKFSELNLIKREKKKK